MLKLENDHEAAAAPTGAETQEPASGAAGTLKPQPQADLRQSSPQLQALPPQHLQENVEPKKEEEEEEKEEEKEDTERFYKPAAEPVPRRLEHSPGTMPSTAARPSLDVSSVFCSPSSSVFTQ